MTTVCAMFVHVRSCIRAHSRLFEPFAPIRVFFYSFISQTKQWRVNEIHTEIARSRAIRSKVLWSTCNSAIAIILSYQVRKSFHKNHNTLIHPFVYVCHFSHSLSPSFLMLLLFFCSLLFFSVILSIFLFVSRSFSLLPRYMSLYNGAK